jgi:arylformamidase
MIDGDLVFGEYTQADLDAQYDNGATVPSVDDIVACCEAMSEAVRAKYDHSLDIPYGPSGMEKLDIIRPTNKGRALVNIFIHGGFWMRRDKNDYGFIAKPFTGCGAITVVMNYALTPSVDLDEVVRQCRAAVAWAHGNIAEHGGDPNKIFVSGNSAGGHLVAMLMATDWPAYGSLPKEALKGGVALSGIYELLPIQKYFINDTLNLSDAEVERNSPLNLSPATNAPVIFAVGGIETDEFKRHTREITDNWEKKGGSCYFMGSPGKHHFSIVDDFVGPKSDICKASLKMMGL